MKKKKSEKKVRSRIGNTFTTEEVVILTIITCIVSIIMGSFLGYRLKKETKETLPSDLQEFINNYQYIVDNNVADVASTDLIKGAIEGMLSTFEDDYSYVIDEDEQENFDIRLQGEYQGIGVEIITTNENKTYISDIFEDSPAFKAGLKIGDRILKIDGEDYSDKTSTEIGNYIKKNTKTTFTLTVERDGKEETFSIKRQRVTINSVSSRTFEKNDQKIGYIYINIFSASAYLQFKEKLQALEKDNIDSLIVDVRYNNGGHLTTAQSILSLFLDSSNVIYQIEKNGEKEKFYSTGKVTKTYPIVVLQNSSSASASELLSAGLKEQYGAKVVGEKSYGKGTVQELIHLSDGTEYKFTTKKWLTPKGNWIHKVGVDVDYEVSLDSKYFEEPTDENDTQLQKALSVLAEKEG